MIICFVGSCTATFAGIALHSVQADIQQCEASSSPQTLQPCSSESHPQKLSSSILISSSRDTKHRVAFASCYHLSCTDAAWHFHFDCHCFFPPLHARRRQEYPPFDCSGCKVLCRRNKPKRKKFKRVSSMTKTRQNEIRTLPASIQRLNFERKITISPTVKARNSINLVSCCMVVSDRQKVSQRTRWMRTIPFFRGDCLTWLSLGASSILSIGDGPPFPLHPAAPFMPFSAYSCLSSLSPFTGDSSDAGIMAIVSSNMQSPSLDFSL